MAPPVSDGGTTGSADNYYEVLGVPFEATEDDVRKRYHSIVRTLHPDRRRPGSSSGDALERFHQVQSAWRCLSDPTRRLLYDLRNFGRSSLAAEAGLEGGSPTAEAKLVCLQKEQAIRDVSNMQVVLEKVLRREQAARGVVIRKALYGDLRLRQECLEECMAGKRAIDTQDLVGPVIDVAMPVQCLVEQHTIVLPGGASASKADLPGFYNPAPLDLDVELGLYVLYEFRGHLHEVLVGDRETLSLPYRKHAVPTGQTPRGPFSPANVTLLRGGRGAQPAGGRAAARARAETGAGAARGARRKEADASEALQRAVAAYRRDWVSARSMGEAAPREFAAVALAAGAALTLAAWWAAADGHRRRG